MKYITIVLDAICTKFENTIIDTLPIAITIIVIFIIIMIKIYNNTEEGEK